MSTTTLYEATPQTGTVSSTNLTSLYSNTGNFTAGTVNSSVYSVNGGVGVTVNPTTGNVVVSIGQDVATTANPTFNNLTLNGNTIYRSGGNTWMNYSQTINSLGQNSRVTNFNVTAPTGVIVSNVDIDSRVVYNTGVLTTSTTTADQILFAIDADANRSLTASIQVTSGSVYQTLEVAVLHDGTNTYINTYSDLRTGANLTSVSALFVAGSPNRVNLVVTPVNAVTSYIATTKTIIV
jgi:hypothetical protein